MNVREASLPWTGAPVRVMDDLQNHLRRHLQEGHGAYLPRSITLFIDPEVAEKKVQEFLEQMVSWLAEELDIRLKRSRMFVQLGLFSAAEIDAFLTGRTGTQPWAIYYSAHGGLGFSDGDLKTAAGADHGVIPCSSMRNHGVAWARSNHGATRVWLATARKEREGWDWDSDIGHESAHAAFAQVPLFTQLLADAIDQSSLSQVNGIREMSPANIARMTYFYSEIAVVAIRGENRQTPSGLPVAEMQELGRLLELSNELSPEAGFQEAMTAYMRCHDSIDVSHSTEIYEIATPIIRAIPRLTGFVNAGEPPDISAFRKALQG
jgi:hypothetical protein